MSEPAAVLVAGADTASGRAVAERFAADGARLALCGNSEASLADVAGDLSPALTLPVDRRDLGAVETAVERVLDALGAVDVLVTCPEPPPRTLIEDIAEDQWREVIDGVLKGAFGFAKFASKSMVERTRGRIVNVGLTDVSGQGGYTHAAAAGAGLVSLTRTLALELARFSVSVNAVVPGLIAWDASDADAVAGRARPVPARRAGSGRDLADIVYVLASEAAAYVTGQTLHVDGGRALLPALVVEPPEGPST